MARVAFLVDEAFEDSSRRPDDLPASRDALVRQLEHGAPGRAEPAREGTRAA